MKKMKIKSSHYLCRSANDYSFSVCYGQQSSSHLVYVCVYDVHLLAACVLSVCRIHLPNTVRSTYTHLLDTCHSMSYVLDDFYVLCRCASWLVVGRMQRLIASLECDIYGVNGRKWRPNEWADHPAICTNEFHSAWFWKFMAWSIERVMMMMTVLCVCCHTRRWLLDEHFCARCPTNIRYSNVFFNYSAEIMRNHLPSTPDWDIKRVRLFREAIVVTKRAAKPRRFM